MRPNAKDLKLDLFKNADFAGLFTAENNKDHISVKIKSRLLFNFDGIPIFWRSKLQFYIALLTLEAKVHCFVERDEGISLCLEFDVGISSMYIL